MDLNDEEKAVIWRILQESPKKLSAVFDYGVYVLPTLLFAGYGIWKMEFAAMLVAYVALLIVVVLYLSYSHRSAGHLRNALKKYEAEVGALKQNE
jgi:hypothetical protein